MLHRDQIETYKGCIIQHGCYNDRIYVLKVTPSVSSKLPYDLISLATEKKYSKIFIKIPEKNANLFFMAGFVEEARIPDYFYGNELALFMGYYLNNERKTESDIDKITDVFKIASNKKINNLTLHLDNMFIIRKCNEEDVVSMSQIYKEIFPSYPFPIDNPDYLLKTMRNHIEYFCIETENGLVALSSAEKDNEALNVEMTDFATLQKWQGKNFALHLLLRMENEMVKKNFKTAYTIARATSPGMNVTFSKAKYQFGGRLKNNTNISGKIESMNVWYKLLDK